MTSGCIRLNSIKTKHRFESLIEMAIGHIVLRGRSMPLANPLLLNDTINSAILELVQIKGSLKLSYKFFSSVIF